MCTVLAAVGGVIALGTTVNNIRKSEMAASDRRDAEKADRAQHEFSAANYAAQVAYDRYMADRTRAEGDLAADSARTAGRLKIGAARAAYGASGMDANVGSPMDYAADLAAASEYDARALKARADQEAWKLDRQAMLAERSLINEQDQADEPVYKSSALDLLPHLFNFAGNAMSSGAWGGGAGA